MSDTVTTAKKSPLIPRPGIADAPLYIPGAHGSEDDTVVLSANENPLGPSPKAIAAFSAETSLHRYPDGGAEALRNAIGARFDLHPARIVCGAGSDELITLISRCFVGPDDEILQSRHGFLMYSITATTLGAKTIMAPETDLHSDVDALLAGVTDRTRICFIANPNNPTGTYIPASEIRRLRDGLRPDILMVIDAAYSEYVDAQDYTDGRELVEDYDNVVMMRTFSKMFGLAALRLGWCYAPDGVVDLLNRVRGPFNVSAPAQAAGIAALADWDYVERSIAENKEQRARLSGALTQLGLAIPPSVGNFVLARFEDAQTAKRANDYLANRNVIVRNVAGYGLPESLRITVGTAEENTRLLEALTDFMSMRR